jgi:hypothetical protein
MVDANAASEEAETMRATDYTFDEVEAAIMLFSAVDEYNTLISNEGLPRQHPNKPCEKSVRRFRENMGCAETRRVCIALAPLCEAVWLAIPEDERDGITWDWEFVPAFVLFCVNWHHWQDTRDNASTEDLLRLYPEGTARSAAFNEPGDVGSALEAAVQGKANALIVVEDPLVINQRKPIVNFAANTTSITA